MLILPHRKGYTCVENWPHQNRKRYPQSKSSPLEFFYVGCKLPASLDIFYFQKFLFTLVIITITKFLKCTVSSQTLSSIPAVFFRSLAVNEPTESRKSGISRMIALSSRSISFCGCPGLRFRLSPFTESNDFAAWRYILLCEYFGKIFNSSSTLTPLSWNKYLIRMNTASGIFTCFFCFIMC